MATLADLLGSVNTSNMNAGSAPVDPWVRQEGTFKRPGGFKKVAGSILDVLAGMGGRQLGYTNAVNAQEQAYNQAMQKQQFQNVFRNFVQSPDDPLVQANLAEVSPETFMKVAPQNTALGNRVVRMGPLGTPEVVVEAPAEPVAPVKPDLRSVQGVGLVDATDPNQPRVIVPARSMAQPRAAASGGKSISGAAPILNGGKPLPGNSVFAQRYNVILQNDGPEAAAEFARTNKGEARGGPLSQSRLGSILDTLENRYETLKNQGGAITEDAGVMSNLANYLASTGIGGVAARIVGSPAQTERDAIAGVQNALLGELKRITGKSAQELNSIPEFQFALKQATDPSVGYEANLKGLNFLRQIYLSGGNIPTQGGKKNVAPSPTPAAPTATDAQGRKVMWNGSAWVPVR